LAEDGAEAVEMVAVDDYPLILVVHHHVEVVTRKEDRTAIKRADKPSME